LVYTTVAWYQVAALTLAELNAVADEHLTVSGKDITIPIGLPNVIALMASGATLSRARLVSPSLRSLFLEEIQPFANSAALTPTGEDHEIVERFANPIPLVESEKLNAVVTCGTSGCVVAMLADAPITPVTGNIRTLRATASIADSAGAWASGTLSLAQTLPAGRYQVVGLRVVDAYGIAARLIFVGQPWRPGVPCAPSILSRNDQNFRLGRAGVLGEFEFDQPPQLEVLSIGTGTSQEVFLDLIQVRAGR
jgi:hypothetical protein